MGQPQHKEYCADGETVLASSRRHSTLYRGPHCVLTSDFDTISVICVTGEENALEPQHLDDTAEP